MTKFTRFITPLLFATVLSSVSAQTNARTKSQPQNATPGKSKTLVVYFSMPETSKTSGLTRDEENSLVVVDGKALGNTQYVALLIAQKTGADIFRIESQTPYPLEHKKLVDLASEEQKKNARPKIKGTLPDLKNYDTVFVGYPNWWGDMPMILYSFFDAADLSCKVIVPFCTHGGSGLSRTVQTISRLENGASVERNALSIYRDDVSASEKRVESWLKEIGLLSE